MGNVVDFEDTGKAESFWRLTQDKTANFGNHQADHKSRQDRARVSPIPADEECVFILFILVWGKNP
jgi:hypothetical protein